MTDRTFDWIKAWAKLRELRGDYLDACEEGFDRSARRAARRRYEGGKAIFAAGLGLTVEQIEAELVSEDEQDRLDAADYAAERAWINPFGGAIR